jgi:hypothetical protein
VAATPKPPVNPAPPVNPELPVSPRRSLPVALLAVGACVLLLIGAAAVFIATRSNGGDMTNVPSNSNLATPAANSNANARATPTPQPRTPTPTATPTPARSPVRVFPTNLNLRRPVNRNN